MTARFEALLKEIGELHRKKNDDYAGGGPPLGNFERVARLLVPYVDAGLRVTTPASVALIYMLKQLDAVFWLTATQRDGQVESIAERLKDIAVYALLAITMLEPSVEQRIAAANDEALRAAERATGLSGTVVSQRLRELLA